MTHEHIIATTNRRQSYTNPKYPNILYDQPPITTDHILYDQPPTTNHLKDLGQDVGEARLDRLGAALRHHPERRHRRLSSVRLRVAEEGVAQLHEGGERVLRGEVQGHRVEAGLRDRLGVRPVAK